MVISHTIIPPFLTTISDKKISTYVYREEGFYQGGTLSLTTSTNRHGGQSHPIPVIYDPYPDYNSPEWQRKWQGSVQACRGPRGDNLDRTSLEDMVSVYRGTQSGFPHPMFGSHEAMGLDQNVCSDRYSRYGLYGLENDNENTEIPGFARPREIDWDGVEWGKLQSECYDRNANRFNALQVDQKYSRHVLSIEQEIPEQPPQISDTQPKGRFSSSSPLSKSRSAVVLRASSKMEWTQSHRQYLRSLIMELSLHSGSEYKVFFMLDDHDPNYPIEDNPEEADRLIEAIVPPEFRNITVVFNDPVMARWYPKINEHRAIYQHLQPLQVFSQLYPEFDYYWQLEFDARVIGHTYHFLEQAVDFAKRQPRKYLWERNAYFYTPGAHGTWDDFSHMVAKSMAGKQSVWGPVPARGITVSPHSPKPPVARPEDDNFKWGVGEEADLITFLPIFNPERTSWTFPWMMWNLPGDNPRRSSVITQWRVSRRLLTEMHQASRRYGMALASEMSAPSWALLHGFKAVHVPQPLYVDGKWTPKEMARIFNPGPPENINGESDSIWNWNHRFDYLWYRFSYMFTTQTAEDLFRRWLGFGSEPDLHRSGIRVRFSSPVP